MVYAEKTKWQTDLLSRQDTNVFTSPTTQSCILSLCISMYGNAPKGSGTPKLLRMVRGREMCHGSLRASLLLEFLMTRVAA